MNPRRPPGGLNLKGLNAYMAAAEANAQAARTRAARGEESEPAAFGSLNARELYCPECKRAMPVRERMLLVLPGGELFEYTCEKCGTSLGTRRT